MMLEARQAMLLQRVRYGSAGLTAREALHVATSGGAGILGWEQAGELREGMLADIALFDLSSLAYSGSWSDPVAALLFCGVDRSAKYVIANGEFVVDGGKLVGVDEEALADDARRVSSRLLAKAGLKG
jgi:cytosine/adenosine deaminase-related metal-dependent hydrolase